MKLIILALILSLSLHFLLLDPFSKKEEEHFEKPAKSKNINKSEVRYVKLMSSKPIKKPVVKKTKPIKKKKTTKYKKVEKKKIIPQKKKIVKKPKRIVPKPIEKVEAKPNFVKNVPIKPQEKRETISKKSLENFLLKEPVPLDRNMLDDITKSYISLYGEEYNSFTKVQKVYLQNNLKNIGRITQKYLRYPRIAVKTGQQGMNIVQFFLHPNGDISDLKLVSSSKYATLDKNTIETIEVAYKDYPRPKTKTKIKIYVYYKLY